MRVIVLGAGVIGVSSAYFLARLGYQVTVIEKNSEPAMSCSKANGGQLSYSHIETWAAKTSFLSLLKAAILPNSFLTVSDFANKKFLRWLYEFYKNSSPSVAQENSRKLFQITSYSKEVLEGLMKEEGDLKFDYQNNGILHFFCSKKSFDKAIKDAEYFNVIGCCKAQILNADECVKKEPTLVKIFDEKRLVGGIFYDLDASGNAFLFTRELARICREKYGVIFEFDTEVKNILTNHKKITGVNTSKGVFTADYYVSALGAEGDRFLQGIKVDTKIYPLKGYSLSIAANDEFMAPKLALTDVQNRIVYSRLGNTFRVAGTIEICSLRKSNNQRHISFLKRIIRATFSDFGNVNKVEAWFGFRPFRPNSIPLICKVKKYENLFLNVGHGSLGWTMAAASGKLLSERVAGRKNEGFSFLEESDDEF